MIARNINNIANQIANKMADRLSSPKAQLALDSLNFALDFLKPYVRALGIRVARLSKKQVELVLPSKAFSQKSRGRTQEAAVLATALEAYEWLWNQNRPEAGLEINFRSVQLEIVKPLLGELRFKFELNEINREKVLLELSRDQKSEDEAQVLIYSNDDQLCAQVELRALLTQAPVLEWT